MTCANYGKGKAMMSGSFIGNATYPETDPGNTQFMVNLMNWAGIERPFTTSHDGISQIPVEVRLQENEKGYLLFILNHSNGQQEVTVDLKVPVDGSYLVREVITEKTSTLKSRGNRLNLTILVGTREVQVLDITLTNP
jgi:beta-galactosidase